MLKPFYKTWVFRVFSPLIFSLYTSLSTGIWPNSWQHRPLKTPSTKFAANLTPLEWRVLTSVELILGAGIWIIATTILTPFEQLLSYMAKGEAKGSFWYITEEAGGYLQFGILTWAFWFVLRGVLFEFIRYVMEAYRIEGEELQRRFRLPTGIVSALILLLTYTHLLKFISYKDTVTQVEIEMEWWITMGVTTGLLLYFTGSLWYNYAFMREKDTAVPKE